jgi:hypothetical protein
MAVDLEKYKKATTTPTKVDLSKYKKQEEPGFLQSTVQSLAKVPLRVASSFAPAIETLAGVSQDEIKQKNVTGRDFGYFGKVKPLGYQASDNKPLGETAVNMVKDTGGVALEAASYLVPAAKASALAKPTIAGKVFQAGTAAMKTGATSGFLYGAGSELQNEESTLGSVAGNAALGTVIGGGTGFALGSAAAVPKALQAKYRPTNEQAVVRLNEAYDELFNATKSGANKLEKTLGTGRDPRRFLSENGIVVDITPDNKISSKAARQTLFKRMDQIDDALTEGLKGTGKVVDLADVEKRALAALDNAKSKADGSILDRQAQVKNIFEKYRKIYGDQVPLDILNEIKRGQTGLTRVFDATKPKFMTDVHYQVSKAARELVEEGAKDLPVHELNAFWADHLSAVDILKKVNGNAISGGKIGKYFSRTAGAVSGSILGSQMGPLGSVVGAGVGDVVGGALQKSAAKEKVLPSMVKRAIEQGTLKYGDDVLQNFRESSQKLRSTEAMSIPNAAQNNIDTITPTVPPNANSSMKKGAQVLAAVPGIQEDENGDISVNPTVMATALALGSGRITPKEARRLIDKLSKKMGVLTQKTYTDPKKIQRQEHDLKNMQSAIRMLQQNL